MYDLIGDIHGNADELIRLLEALGYEKAQGVYRHPERKVIFLGDFIDRGPKIREALEVVRPMVEAGHALAIMGNHELNALAYYTEDPEEPGQYLRRRNPKNDKQIRKTVEQLNPQELRSYLEWCRTLPLWLDLKGLRVIHACWDEVAIAQIAAALEEHGGVTTSFLRSACRKGNALFHPVEVILKGREAKLPDGLSFHDSGGNVRTEIRTRWYLSPRGQTYRTYALHSEAIPCDLTIDESVIQAATSYPTTAKPVFFGHYWLSDKRPELLAENVACIDYGQTRGFLCGYRWNGEQTLSNANFVWVQGD